MIIIGKPFLEVNDTIVRLTSSITENNYTRKLWFEAPIEYGDFFCDEVSDAFLVAIILAAVNHCVDIRSEAPISAKLLYNLRNIVVPSLTIAWKGSKAKRITITAPVAENIEYAPFAVATGCSLGVDSFSAIIEHTKEECIHSYRLTHLTLFHCGAHGWKFTQQEYDLYKKDLQRVKAFSEKIDIPLVSISSNISDFYEDMSFAQSHTVRNMSAVLSMQKLFKKYLYASGVSLSDFQITNKDIAYFESLFLPAISTEHTELISIDADKTRLEKVKLISNNPMVMEFLNVCMKDQISVNPYLNKYFYINSRFPNCGKCEKCLRTLLTLESIGVNLSCYERLFDLDTYYRCKWLYLGCVLGLKKENVYYKEIYSYAKNNLCIPIKSRILSIVVPKQILRKLAWRIFKIIRK